MSHFLYPSRYLTGLPHLDRIFENLLENRRPSNNATLSTRNENSSNYLTGTADIYNYKNSHYSSGVPNEQNNENKCWICLDNIETSKQQWTKPCKCSLISHQRCLLAWIDENQRLSPKKKVYCPQCSSLYVLSEENSLPLAVKDLTDSVLHGITPYITILGLGCSILITSTSFGILTVFTLFGRERGERIIGDSENWTWKTWLGLPAIPAVLIGSRFPILDKFFPLFSTLVLRLSSGSRKSVWPPSPAILFGSLSCARLIYNYIYKKIQHKLALEQKSRDAGDMGSYLDYSEQNSIYELEEALNISDSDNQDAEASDIMRETDSNDMCFTIAGALLWPTISNVIGGFLGYSKLVRNYFPEPFQRNILGGCLFVIAKDVLNLYFKYERLQQRRSRKVVNYR